MKYASLLIIICILSCNNPLRIKEKDDGSGNDTIIDYDTSSVDPAEKISSCYESIANGDTVYLNLFSASEVITGSLQYRYHEKDNNNGTISGNMYGDTLIADYRFKSEGKTSVREVAFLKQGDAFVEGYSNMEENNGKMFFVNISDLKFTGTQLHAVSCTDESSNDEAK